MFNFLRIIGLINIRRTARCNWFANANLLLQGDYILQLVGLL